MSLIVVSVETSFLKIKWIIPFQKSSIRWILNEMTSINGKKC